MSMSRAEREAWHRTLLQQAARLRAHAETIEWHVARERVKANIEEGKNFFTTTKDAHEPVS